VNITPNMRTFFTMAAGAVAWSVIFTIITITLT